MTTRQALRALADRAGVLPGYRAASGTWHETGDPAREAVLGAMGFDAASEASAAAALAALEARDRDRWIAPVQVVEAGERLRLALHVEPETARGADLTLSMTPDGGRPVEVPIRLRSAGGRSHLSARIPAPGPGAHALCLRVRLPTGTQEHHQTYLVAPRRAIAPEARLAGHRAFGLWANLYSLRSARAASGIGDFAALRSLIQWAAAEGAAFVGLSPLHTVRHQAGETSPYAPVSRLFRNPLYLDLSAVPEWRDAAGARDAGALGALRVLDDAPHVDYAGVAAGKRAGLEALHRAFRRRHAAAGTTRGRAYEAFRSRRGPLLDAFATFLALEDHFAAQGVARDWHAWPRAYRDPDSPSVAAFREQHPETIAFHTWCQFELDRQLADLAGRARRGGLAIGLYSDLAVGSVRSGFDAWAFPGLFAEGVALGAPPDDYAPAGQDWGFPPLAPRPLRQHAYRYFRLLLQTAFEHAGALRIDHALGLARQFWIPAGRPAADGAYVRVPTRDLLRLIALESHRQGALVVGEDLGTVPPGFTAVLARHGVLSTRVLLFERDARGRFRRGSRYSTRALVTAHTHDHPPLRGFVSGRDLDLRRRAGALASDAALDDARARRAREVRGLHARLAAEHAFEDGAPAADGDALCRAAYRFLAATPSPLVGVSVDDLAGETEPINLPGVPPDRFPSWTRRLRVPVERLRRRAATRDILAALAGRRARPR